MTRQTRALQEANQAENMVVEILQSCNVIIVFMNENNAIKLLYSDHAAPINNDKK